MKTNKVVCPTYRPYNLHYHSVDPGITVPVRVSYHFDLFFPLYWRVYQGLEVRQNTLSLCEDKTNLGSADRIQIMGRIKIIIVIIMVIRVVNKYQTTLPFEHSLSPLTLGLWTRSYFLNNP